MVSPLRNSGCTGTRQENKMPNYQKQELSAKLSALLALAITVLISAVYVYMADAGILDFMQTRYSGSMEFILNLSLFLTLYLTIFFLINLKPHPLTIVQDRIKHLREDIFEQLASQEGNKWITDFGQRRDEICSELKRNLKLSRSQETKIDNVINKSLNELLLIFKSGVKETNQPYGNEKTDLTNGIAGGGELKEIEELEAVEEDDEFEGIEELEAIEDTDDFDDNEEIEELEEAEDAVDIDEIEKIIEIPVWPSESSNIKNKGLLALASEIEFNHPVQSDDDETGDLLSDDLPDEIKIVSPFSSMFSSLKNDPASRK